MLLGATLGLRAQAPHPERIYLSGTGIDDTKTWEFFCSKGQNSGSWKPIEVPCCWETQGFGEYTYGRDPSVALEVADGQAGFVPVLRLEDMDGYAPGVSLRDFFALRSREKQLLSINYADCEPVAINADAAELGLPFTGIARILLCDERPDGFAECYLCRDRAGSYQLRDGNSALLGCFSMESKGRFKPLWRLPVLEIVLQPIFN